MSALKRSHDPRWTLGAALLALLFSGCQSVMSIEEAKRVTASFRASSAPPPRTISDILALLDRQERADPEAATRARARADKPLPADTRQLATFYYERAQAAGEIGRTKQQLADYAEAAPVAERAGANSYELSVLIRIDWADAEGLAGNYQRALQVSREGLVNTAQENFSWRMRFWGNIARVSASQGDLETAKAAAIGAYQTYQAGLRRYPNIEPVNRVGWEGNLASIDGAVAELEGRFAKAEAFYRQSMAAFAEQLALAGGGEGFGVDLQSFHVMRMLRLQGRLLEAENQARDILRSVFGKRGRYSNATAGVLKALAGVLVDQGRYGDGERLLRLSLDIYEKTGVLPESHGIASTRDELGAALAAQGRWQEAVGEYEQIRVALSTDPTGSRKFLATNVTYALALFETQRPERAAEILRAALDRRSRTFGERHPSVAEVRGFLAMVFAARGDRAQALEQFAQATEVLGNRSTDPAGDDSGTQGERDGRLSLILAAYIGLLADIQGTPLEQRVGGNAAAVAFRLAEIARGGSVQRALYAGAARAAAKTPALADLVRRHQDAGKHLPVLYGLLASALSAPSDQQDPKLAQGLRSRIDALGRARETLAKQIAMEFPSYEQLTNPPPATLEQTRAALRPNEALIATYVGPDRTFVWAVPSNGSEVFAAIPLGNQALSASISALRKALDSGARTVGQIPPFDVALAYALYQQFLEPVRAGWERADSLLVVLHGPLGQLPLALLPTRPTGLGPEQGLLFSNYRAVPWLVRTHALTVLPSVTSLPALRRMPPGAQTRRPFVGFGDPYFSPQQARQAAADELPPVAALDERLGLRAVPITVRNAPQIRSLDSSQLAQLPRLAETAEEIRTMARAMNADVNRDVFLGVQANEQTVRKLNLADYRVLAFGTHGLVAGDLDGLTQPALALTAPEVAQVEGDGLLTMEKILVLRLDADWVVLSACNTASGQGMGSEAISGLGRAFFYAGARALLVSNWPVETTSAKLLTTELFRRQATTPGQSRAKALQQTLNALIDSGEYVDSPSKQAVFSYAHPIFWAPFTLVGDGG
jgi:CHAT domain-containing protein/tetratricopeptide (TPR) repeat protein